jgi:predicted KAP-like P-loop ATPase
MSRAGYFNDAPILIPDDDRFGIDRFAQALAKSLRDIESPIGATIAINGPWGSGKSSAVNLIRYHLKDDVQSGKLEIIDFSCWWFRGEEALTLAFLQALNASLQKSLGDKAKELIPRLGKTLLQAGPVVGPAINLATGGIWGTLTAGSMTFAKRFFSEGESVERLFQKLSKALDEQDRRFLVFIDDIDRLTPNEALLVFRLVKSVGRLPNVMYLLIFDRELAEKAVTEIYPSEGPHFLEKIIQANFELPLPARDDLNTAALSQIEAFCGSPSDRSHLLRFMNLFYDAISPYLNTPRDLTRLYNAMTISWPAVAKEVNIGDYVALEIMRLFEPLLYNAIRTNKANVCGVRAGYGREENPKQTIEIFLQLVPEKRRENARLAIMRLFPRFENVGYSHDSIREWEVQRRVCTDKHFDTYFRMGIGDETISIAEVDEFVENADNPEYVKQAFRKELGLIRKSGKSKVPLLLDEINVNASRIDKSKFQPLIAAIFEVADEIYRDGDSERGGFSVGDNHLRIHWLIRKLTFDRCNLDERSTIFLVACRNAQVGWLTDFTSSAVADHFPREGRDPEPIEKCLVNKDHLVELKVLCIKAINSAATTGELLFHPQLPFILFRWREFSEDNGFEVRAWTSNQLKIDRSVCAFARAFTGESWSQGMGMAGLGDRVAMRNIRASVSGLEYIIDVGEFRRRLEELEKSEALDGQDQEAVSVFLDAWRKQENGEDRYGHGD